MEDSGFFDSLHQHSSTNSRNSPPRFEVKSFQNSHHVVSSGWHNENCYEQICDGLWLAMARIAVESDVVVESSGTTTFSLAVFLGGEVTFCLEDGQPFNVEAGTAVFFRSEGHASGRDVLRGTRDLVYVDLRYSPEFLASLQDERIALIASPHFDDFSRDDRDLQLLRFRAPAKLTGVAREILDCTFEEGGLRRLFMKAKAIEAYAVAFSHILKGFTNNFPLTPSEQRKITKAIKLVEKHYDGDWTIPRLARTVALTERKLKAGFKQAIGRTIHMHLVDVRIDAAKELLLRGKSVTEVSATTGFSSPSHFTKVFKAKTGLLPRNFGR